MKGFFPKDSFLKVISCAVAIVLWFYVILVVDPSVDITVKDIPIKYANEAMLEERGLSLVADPDATVELKIRGSRKKIANIENKNIYATVDLANMTKVGNYQLPISIQIPYEYDEIVSKNPYNASITIDKIVKVNRQVEIITTGSVANGYIAGIPESSVKTVSLKGASTLVDRIHSVAAIIDFDDRTGEINDKEKIYFIDSNGKQIPNDDELYDAVSMDIDTTDVTCSVMKLKTVPVKVDTTGLDDDYKITIQPENVTIYADNELLDEIVEIKAKAIDKLKLTESGTQKIELVIPEGVSMRDGIKEIMVKAQKRN